MCHYLTYFGFNATLPSKRIVLYSMVVNSNVLSIITNGRLLNNDRLFEYTFSYLTQNLFISDNMFTSHYQTIATETQI